MKKREESEEVISGGFNGQTEWEERETHREVEKVGRERDAAVRMSN